jgi:outer membrane protein
MVRTLALMALYAPGLGLAAGLADLHRLAQQHDAAFSAAQQAHLAGLERLPQARAAVLPTVALSANAGRTRYDSSASAAVGYSPYGYTVSASLPVYAPGNWAGQEQGRLQAESARVALRRAEQDLILRTAQAYFEVLKADAALTVVKAQQAAIAEQLAQARVQFEVGVATIIDTHEAQARFDLTTAQEIEAINALEVKRAALERLIQLPVPALAVWSSKAVLPRIEKTQADWVAQAVQSGWAVQAATLDEQVARAGANKVRADYRPKVNLSASFSDSRSGLSTTGGALDSQTGKLGLDLSWSLYDGGKTDSTNREAQANVAKAHFDLLDKQRQAGQDAREAYLGLVAGLARVKALDAAVQSSQAQINSTRTGLEVGIRTRVDVLNAQQQLASAQKDLDAARYDLLLTGLKLKAAVGDLSEADLKTADARLK